MENTDVANRIMKIIFHATSTINYITTLDLNIKNKFEAREFLPTKLIYYQSNLFIPLFYTTIRGLENSHKYPTVRNSLFTLLYGLLTLP